jgi:hypothetical protein
MRDDDKDLIGVILIVAAVTVIFWLGFAVGAGYNTPTLKRSWRMIERLETARKLTPAQRELLGIELTAEEKAALEVTE